MKVPAGFEGANVEISGKEGEKFSMLIEVFSWILHPIYCKDCTQNLQYEKLSGRSFAVLRLRSKCDMPLKS
jgi:hypothetical protein